VDRSLVLADRKRVALRGASSTAGAEGTRVILELGDSDGTGEEEFWLQLSATFFSMFNIRIQKASGSQRRASGVQLTDLSRLVTFGVVFDGLTTALNMTASRLEMYGSVVQGTPGQWSAGLHLYDCQCVIFGSMFKNLNRTSSGAAIEMRFSYGVAVLEEVTFENCLSDTEGGALLMYQSLISGSFLYFTNNIAGGDGGALAVKGNSFINISASVMQFNSAVSGGGIRLLSSTMVLTDTLLKNNKAVRMGGALSHELSRLHVEGCTFLSNIAEEGGAIKLVLKSGEASDIFVSCNFSNNLASWTGGAISTNDGSVKLLHTVLESNHALVQGGGAIVGRGGSLDLENCTVQNNQAVAGGGGLFLSNSLTLSILGGAIRGNTCGQAGGGLNMQSIVGYIAGCEVASNEAGNDGGGILVYQRTSLVLNGTRLEGNSAGSGADDPGFGGGVCMIGDGRNQPDLLLVAVDVHGNRAKGGAGGAVYWASRVPPSAVDCPGIASGESAAVRAGHACGSWQNNRATQGGYGNVVASDIRRLAVTPDLLLMQQREIQLTEDITVEGRDVYDQLTTSNPLSVSLTVLSESKDGAAFFEGVTDKLLNKGAAVFSESSLSTPVEMLGNISCAVSASDLETEFVVELEPCRMGQLFQCEQLYFEDASKAQWWLVHDMSIECFGDSPEYWLMTGISMVGIIFYTVGWPVGIYFYLKNLRSQVFVYWPDGSSFWASKSDLQYTKAYWNPPSDPNDPPLPQPAMYQPAEAKARDRKVVYIKTKVVTGDGGIRQLQLCSKLDDQRFMLFLGILYTNFEDSYYWWITYELIRRLLSTAGVIMISMMDASYTLPFGSLMAATALGVHGFFSPYISDVCDKAQFAILLNQYVVLQAMFVDQEIGTNFTMDLILTVLQVALVFFVGKSLFGSLKPKWNPRPQTIAAPPEEEELPVKKPRMSREAKEAAVKFASPRSIQYRSKRASKTVLASLAQVDDILGMSELEHPQESTKPERTCSLTDFICPSHDPAHSQERPMQEPVQDEPVADTFVRAAEGGDMISVLQFLRLGHDVNMRAASGETALHRASAAGNAVMIDLLLRAGATLDERLEVEGEEEEEEVDPVWRDLSAIDVEAERMWQSTPTAAREGEPAAERAGPGTRDVLQQVKEGQARLEERRGGGGPPQAPLQRGSTSLSDDEGTEREESGLWGQEEAQPEWIPSARAEATELTKLTSSEKHEENKALVGWLNSNAAKIRHEEEKSARAASLRTPLRTEGERKWVEGEERDKKIQMLKKAKALEKRSRVRNKESNEDKQQRRNDKINAYWLNQNVARQDIDFDMDPNYPHPRD
ncbi:hypothetical protein CYMTET_31731, partial [Cymbomonas tetramitiformis]